MRKILSSLIGLVTLTISATAFPHHSFSAEFDVGRPVEISGTLIDVEWVNPHAWLHIAIVDEQGREQRWAVEMLGVNTLVRRGMTPETVKPGDELTIKGFGARDGTNTANASSVKRSESGETLWASASEENSN